VNEPVSSHTKLAAEPFNTSEWSAFAPGKESWKRDGNFFSAEELSRMDADDASVYQPLEKVLIAD
jgi:hypothetical protein